MGSPLGLAYRLTVLSARLPLCKSSLRSGARGRPTPIYEIKPVRRVPPSSSSPPTTCALYSHLSPARHNGIRNVGHFHLVELALLRTAPCKCVCSAGDAAAATAAGRTATPTNDPGMPSRGPANVWGLPSAPRVVWNNSRAGAAASIPAIYKLN